LIDNPNERSSHLVPTPRAGGIGIYMVVIFGGVFVIRDVLFAFIALVVGLLGFLEDRFALSSRIRLLFQLTLSVAVVFFFLGIPTTIGEISFFLFWVIFITGTANFYNFMDGINGIAGLAGLIGFGLMAYFSYFIVKNLNIALMSIVLSSACLGFLPFNIPKAKVFMGDVGSILLGFVFAAMVMWLTKDMLDFICLSSFLFPFYADELTTMYIRLKSGGNLFKPHRRHLYQIFANKKAIPHWKVSFGYGVFQLIVGLSVLFMRPLGIFPIIVVLLAWSGGFILLTNGIRKKLNV